MASNGTADLAFVNGRVSTMDAARRWAERGRGRAGADRGGRDRRRCPRADRLGDRGGGSRRAGCSCPGSRMRTSTRRRAASRCCTATCPRPTTSRSTSGSSSEYASAHPDDPWIVGGGWSMDVFPGGNPPKEVLDRVVPRSARVPDEPGRSQRVGELARARDRGRDARHARPGGRVDRPRRRRANPRAPCTRARSSSSSGTSPSRRRRIGSRGSSPRSATCMRSGSRRGRTRSSAAATRPSTPTAQVAASGELTARVVGALWWDRYRGIEQVEDLVDARERGRVGRFARHDASRSCRTA